jgi:hypothetical protein
MALFTYMLCGLTAATCSVLLLRAYRQSGVPLLWWSGVCFALLTANNLLVAVDLVLFPKLDLFVVRNITALCGVSVLLYALIWESEG